VRLEWSGLLDERVLTPKIMSGAAGQYEQRGGVLRRLNAASANFIDETAQFNPTTSSATSITEHDYRFPRRPDKNDIGHQGFSAFEANSLQSDTNFASPTDSSANALDKLDLSGGNSARKDLLRENFFRTWKDDAAGEEPETPEEMQKKDPLATQIWRLYSKTKRQLPNQERMENLTWRMMAMSLRKRQQEEEAARYACEVAHASQVLTKNDSKSKQNSTTAPSGISLLRKSSDQHTATSNQMPTIELASDAMNLDDFIFADNMSTPAGIGLSPTPEPRKQAEKATNNAASAIPIKARKDVPQFAVPQSVPAANQYHRNHDFNYVQRHVRKTSIDERRVSSIQHL